MQQPQVLSNHNGSPSTSNDDNNVMYTFILAMILILLQQVYLYCKKCCQYHHYYYYRQCSFQKQVAKLSSHNRLSHLQQQFVVTMLLHPNKSSPLGTTTTQDGERNVATEEIRQPLTMILVCPMILACPIFYFTFWSSSSSIVIANIVQLLLLVHLFNQCSFNIATVTSGKIYNANSDADLVTADPAASLTKIAPTITYDDNQQIKKSSDSSLSILLSSPSIVYVSFLLSLASFLDVYYFIFIIPIILLLQQHSYQTNEVRRRRFIALPVFVLTTLFLLLLHSLSMLLFVDDMDGNISSSASSKAFYYSNAIIKTYGGRQQYSDSAYRSTIIRNNPSPTLSLLWYFRIELLLPFQNYFLYMIYMLPYFTIIPITIRLYKYPTTLIAIFWMIGVLFHPTNNTLYHLFMGLFFIMLNPSTILHMNLLPTIIALCALPIPVVLYTVAYYMYSFPVNGEANYLFFQCLVYNVFVAILLLSFCAGSLRHDKVVRMIAKENAKVTTIKTNDT